MNQPVELPFITRLNVEAEVRRIAGESTKDLVLLDHAKDRMLEREITERQSLNVLKNGDIMDAPKWDTEKERGWRCQFRGIAAGIDVTVITKLVKRDNTMCLIITVY